MKVGELKFFCECLVKREHITDVNEEGICLYCGYYCVERGLTPKDIRLHNKWQKRLDKAKMDILSIMAREKNHNEKIN